MNERIQCPVCLTVMTADARFCPGCGTPRTWVRTVLEHEAARTGTSYQSLLEGARRGTVRLVEPQAEPLVTTTANRLILVVLFVVLAAPLAIVFSLGGAGWLVSALLVAAIGVLYNAFAGRVERLEARLRLLEMKQLAGATTESVDRIVRETPPTAGVQVPVSPPPMTAPVWNEADEPTSSPVPVSGSQSRAIGDIEDLLSGRVLAWVGGLAIVLGAAFFLSLAFSRGWIGPSSRVMIGAGSSLLMVLAGGWSFERRERIVGHVLVAVGLCVMSLSLLAATSFYDLIAVEVALLGVFISASLAATIAIRANSQIVALYGLVAALVAPLILNADADGTTIAFLAVTLIGTTAIALFRTWSWLPPVAFLLTAPQLASWLVDGPPLARGLIVLGGFWLLNAFAAAGEEIRLRSRDAVVRSVSATVLLGNAAFVVWGGFQLLVGEYDGWRGSFLVGVAIAHGLLGGWFLIERGELHPFGLLAAGTGVAAFSIAIPVQLGGPIVPIAWAAEAAVLAWVYGKRQHRYSALAGMVLLGGSLVHLVTIEYPFWEFGESVAERAFLNQSGGTLAFILGALLVGGWLVRQVDVRVGLAVIGTGVFLYALPFEVRGLWLLTTFALLAFAAFTFDQWLERVPGFAEVEQSRIRRGLLLPAAASAVAAIAHALLFDMPIADLAGRDRPTTPFSSDQTLAAVILVAASLGAAAVARWQSARAIGVLVASVVMAYLMPFELRSAAVVVAWAVLGAVLLAVSTRLQDTYRLLAAGAATLAGLGTIVTFALVAPIERLFVDASSAIDHPMFLSGATAALAALAFLVLGFAWRYREWSDARWLVVGSGALVVYLLSVGTVDVFQARVGGDIDLDSLKKQAQVALSILWAVLGVAAFVTGILRGRTLSGAPLRGFGLALLALATLKVFIYDLASLDASYRVLSFIGLGILLLASSYVYQRLTPGRGRPPSDVPSG